MFGRWFASKKQQLRQEPIDRDLTPASLIAVSIEALSPLWDTAKVSRFSLQVGPHAADLHRLPAGKRVENLAPALDDLSETAEAICTLDLVISVDTAAAHLTSTLGRTVWIILL